jgi:branched-subunit amino acid aminotransferase/4-amino-4-deoxychorismate lyase
MDQPQAYLNGKWIPAAAATVPVGDAGFVLGATVAEQLRTFGGRLFHLDDHLTRLEHSLRIVGVDPGMARDELAAVAEQLAACNHRLLAPGDDLGLSIFVTPGDYPAYSPPGPARPTVCLHTYPLPFRLWAAKYREGQALVTTDVEQVSPRSWPASLKCRSRMHYCLADKQAAAVDPQARALLLDAQGFVTEASTANLVIYNAAEGLVSPPGSKILHGISLSAAAEFARRLGIGAGERELATDDVAAAEEAMLASTPLCLLPVTRLNGRPIGDGNPGPVFRRLLSAWSEAVGIDIAAQAERFAHRDG